MTVCRKIARLKMGLAEAERYTPSSGIDVLWLECIHADRMVHGGGICSKASEVVAELVTSDGNPAPGEAHDAKFLEYELASCELEFKDGKEKVIKEELPEHENSPDIALDIEFTKNGKKQRIRG